MSLRVGAQSLLVSARNARNLRCPANAAAVSSLAMHGYEPRRRYPASGDSITEGEEEASVAQIFEASECLARSRLLMEP